LKGRISLTENQGSMDIDLKTKYFELKEKRHKLLSAHSKLEVLKKELMSSSLAAGNYQSKVDEIERKIKSIRYRIWKTINLENELIIARQKLDKAEKHKQDFYLQMTQLNVEIDELNKAAFEYENIIICVGETLTHPDTKGLLIKIKALINQRESARQAFENGKQIDRELEEITEKLWESKEAGFLDFLGLPFLGDFLKYKQFKKSTSKIYDLKRTIEAYTDQLSQIEMVLHVPEIPNISGRTQFFDYVFDGMLVDGSVLIKIHRALDDYNLMQRRVRRIQSQLDILIQETNLELQNKLDWIIEVGQLDS